MMLPKLAAEFDITVDELLGYEPQLSSAEIKRHYHRMAEEFNHKTFQEVKAESEVLMKKYPTCYLLTYRMCVLWLNHVNLIEPKEQKNVFEHILTLCEEINEKCDLIELCADTKILRCTVLLQMGRAVEVVDLMESAYESTDFYRNKETILAQAFHMLAEKEKEEATLQIYQYQHLIGLFADGIQYMQLLMEQPERFLETQRRLQGMIDVFDLSKLHENLVIIFSYQSAVFFAMTGEEEKAMEQIGQIAQAWANMKAHHITLHGDAYFSKIEDWFKKQDFDADAPRNKEQVAKSMAELLAHPAFECLKEKDAFVAIRKNIEKDVKAFMENK